MPATKAAIDHFFAQNRIAVVGVSRKRAHFSRIVFSALRKQGYEAIPVNPNAAEIDGVPSAGSLRQINPPPGAVLVLTRKAQSGIVQETAAAGAKVLWLFDAQECEAGASSRDLEIVQGECPLMFLPHSGWIHSAHRGLRSLFGTLPR